MNSIRPTSWNFAVTMSLSNGFMMYSSAPACSARNVRDVVFGGAEHDLGRIAAGHTAQIAEEFVTVHDGHVPVEQDRVGHGALAHFERLLAVLGFGDLEMHFFQDAACDFSNDA